MPELMKGHVYADRKHTVKYPCIAEVKYDEIRVHVKYVGPKHTERGGGDAEEYVQFLSYAGKPLANLGLYSHIFLEFFRESGLTELDMGLEVNGNFADSYRWVRSTKGIPQEKFDKATGKTHPALDASMVRWWLFDIPESDKPFYVHGVGHMLDRERVRLVRMMELRTLGLVVEVPAGDFVTSEEGLDALFINRRREGYEGLMVKQLDHTYQKGKRTDGWLKMKPEAEADGVITGMTEAISEDGVPLGRAGSVTIRMEDGSVASPHGIAHELGTHMWEHPHTYLGLWCTMNYMERDRAGGYRHPTFGRLREAKS